MGGFYCFARSQLELNTYSCVLSAVHNTRDNLIHLSGLCVRSDSTCSHPTCKCHPTDKLSLVASRHFFVVKECFLNTKNSCFFPLCGTTEPTNQFLQILFCLFKLVIHIEQSTARILFQNHGKFVHLLLDNICEILECIKGLFCFSVKVPRFNCSELWGRGTFSPLVMS